MKDRRISFENGYDQAIEDVFAYLEKNYLLRRVKIPMRWVSHKEIKKKFIDNE